MKFVWGFVWIAIGILLLRYKFQVVGLFGKIDWAERHLRGGYGGTYLLYQIVGVLICFFALMYMFGGLDLLVDPLAPVFTPPPAE